MDYSGGANEAVIRMLISIGKSVLALSPLRVKVCS